MRLCSSLEFALALRFIDAERVDLGVLVQEPHLRRRRDGQLRACDNDRLAELAVPLTERDFLSFERREIELIAAKIDVDGREIAGPGARCRLADGAHRGPRLEVQRPHEALGKALE